MARLTGSATPSPARISTNEISRLSVNNWRPRRARPAPIAWRSASSGRRAAASASIKLARFAQAISSTSTTMHSSITSGRAKRPRSVENPMPPGSRVTALRSNARSLRGGRGSCGAGSKPGHYLQPAHRGPHGPGGGYGLLQRHPDIGRPVDIHAAEALLRDADDGEVAIGVAEVLAQRARIASVVRAPIRFADHRHGALGRARIAGMKDAPAESAHAQHIEVVAGDGLENCRH